MDEKVLTKIHEFDPQVYPQKLWISIGLDTPLDMFEDVSEFDNRAYAMTERVYNKQTGKSGILIRFADIESLNFENVTHESFHTAAEIMCYCGATMPCDNQEPAAYLCGWVARCIEQVKKQINGQ